MEWVDGNIGSKLTMKYPAVILKGRGAKGMVLSIAVAGKGQHQDAGAKMIHLAPDTTLDDRLQVDLQAWRQSHLPRACIIRPQFRRRESEHQMRYVDHG